MRYCAGSTGVEPLRISKCSCGAVTLPVWPDLAITCPRFTSSPRLTSDFAGVRVGGHETIAVTHQHQIAVTLQLVSGIGDDAVFGGFDRRALGDGKVDAVVLQAVRLRPEAGDDAAAHRPAEGWQSARGFSGLDRALRDRLRRRRGKARAVRGFRGRERRTCGRRRGGFDARRGRNCGCSRLPYVRNDNAVADPHHGIGPDIVGLGERHDRLAVEARDTVQRLSGGNGMDARSRRERAPRRTNRRAGRHGRRVRGDAGLRWRNRGCRRRPAIARDHQVLARMHHRRAADAVCFHDGADRHAMAPGDRFQSLAGRHDDRLAALPGPFRRRSRAGGPLGIIAGGTRHRPALDTAGTARRERAGHFIARIVGSEGICEAIGISAAGDAQSD